MSASAPDDGHGPGFEGFDRVGEAPRTEPAAPVAATQPREEDPDLTVPNIVRREASAPVPVAFEPPAPAVRQEEAPTPSAPPVARDDDGTD